MSRFKIILTSVALMLIVANCKSESRGGEFAKDGVSFRYAAGWSITEQEDIDGQGYYLSVEKGGFDESGLITVTWVDGEFDEEDYLEILQDGFRDQDLLSELEFESERKDSFAGYKTMSCIFHFNVLNIDHSGIIHILVFNEKTFSFVLQEALEDQGKNKQGFQMLESSFNID